MSDLAPTLPNLRLFGAGGHGRVVADAALLMRAWGTVVASDRDAAKCVGELLPGIPLMAMTDSGRADGARSKVHVAIGHNGHRLQEVLYWMNCWGADCLATVVHPSATVSPFATVDAGCFVAAAATLAPGSRVGLACIINHGVVVDHDVQIDAFSHLAPNATLGGGVVVGQRVLIGAGAVVLPGVCIFDDVVIGAGAVVRTSITEPGIYVGVPARRMK